MKWQLEPEGASHTKGGFDPDFSMHQLNQTLGDGQAQSCAAKPSPNANVSLRKRLEDSPYSARLDSDAGVLDLEPDLHNAINERCLHDPEPDLPFLSEFDRIPEQIDQDLLQPEGVSHHPEPSKIGLAVDK
ncbi:hypothetical protein LMG27198_39380 [Methylocystis echinoides]|uniref:Uncharacterized protein n=1 Tax=Methylocystis echinoides TaxID=29468 RepID=A0A9W6GXK8_9HYPH|nr:hypothetical protein LMG27198_39380 [Methylocystis echinoides]